MDGVGEGAVRKLTMRRIAEEAEVSVGLVSAFLSGRSYGGGGGSGIRMGAETAHRIRECCRRLGYQPGNGRTYRMLYPELSPMGMAGSSTERFQHNRYHSMILDGVIAATTQMKLNLSMLQYDPKLDYEAYPEQLPEWSTADGVSRFIIAGHPNQSLLRQLVQRGKDVVYASRDPEIEGVAAVVPDYRQAARIAIHYLNGKGHERVGLYGLGYFSGTYILRELLAGARDAAADLNVSLVEITDPKQGASNISADDNLHGFSLVQSGVTAVFAFDDLSAERVLQWAATEGIRVPDQLSVMGCNDERAAAVASPPLTTIHLPVQAIGQRSVELLQQIAIKGADALRRETLPVYLVERASVSAPRF